ncbi:MAG: anaerobic sulfatase maturase [Bacteroidales bacterium]|nr:anaerobic sulfatase maturase [Bacteroidales bacterium]
MKKNYLTLSDAIKIQGPKAFTAMTKPVGSNCNLYCKYCYYLDKERFYGTGRKLFPDDLLERYIRQYIESNQVPVVSFVWHGGEPLMAGLDFYKRVVELQFKHNPQKKRIENSIQTNATLLNEEWCRFFKKYDFLVGVSIDGPKSIHDENRINREGFSSFDKTIKGIDLLKRFKVEFNTLSVVSNLSEGKGKSIYIFLKSLGSHYMQFLPAVDYITQESSSNPPLSSRPIIVSPFLESSAIPAPWSVSAAGYGKFLTDIFDEWVVNDVGKIFVQLFDLTLASWVGIEPSVCVYRETCGDNIAVEHNGDVYSCDHFVYPEHIVGNLYRDDLQDIISSGGQINFGINKRNTLSRECLRCEYYFACGGECPKHRHFTTGEGEKKFALCEGIKAYYKHTEPYMKYMVELLAQERAPREIIPWARSRRSKPI